MSVILSLIICAMLVGIDQLLKFIVVENLYDGGFVTVIEGVLRFRYVENTGAVFGSFSNHTMVLTIFSVVLLGFSIFLLVTNRKRSKFVNVCLLLMISGGIGNIIDRIRLGYVIDFIEPLFVNFAVFNFADCLITVGAFVLVGYLIYDLVKDVKKNKSTKNTEDNSFDETNGKTEKPDGTQ
ncbi:MAG: signal peptidase II [Clostridia bacterium]|nr:signal peptidase II [Clostridia bacterium]